MSENIKELKGIDEIPMFSWNTETKEFYVAGHKLDGINSMEDFINYIHNLKKENQELKERVEMYENPADLTLMFMYCTEKVKDKIKQLQQEKESLNSLVNSCQEEIRKLKRSLENATTCYTNKHKYTSECEDKVIMLKSVLKEIREYLKEKQNLKNFSKDNRKETAYYKLIRELLEKINKGIGEDK